MHIQSNYRLKRALLSPTPSIAKIALRSNQGMLAPRKAVKWSTPPDHPNQQKFPEIPDAIDAGKK